MGKIPLISLACFIWCYNFALSLGIWLMEWLPFKNLKIQHKIHREKNFNSLNVRKEIHKKKKRNSHLTWTFLYHASFLVMYRLSLKLSTYWHFFYAGGNMHLEDSYVTS